MSGSQTAGAPGFFIECDESLRLKRVSSCKIDLTTLNSNITSLEAKGIHMLDSQAYYLHQDPSSSGRLSVRD
uniref:Uncharacterized protein n=1 Tax=Equus asinus asinus TaxID=83772 RepID=A0A8C4LJQ7_EQUAS